MARHFVSCELRQQSSSSDMSLAIENLQRLSEWMSQYRQTRFNAARAREIADELKIDPTIPEKRVRKKKALFDYEARDEVVTDAQESFRINCFNRTLDRAVSSIDTRSQQLTPIHALFGFLYSFRHFSKEQLMTAAKTWRSLCLTTDAQILTATCLPRKWRQ